MSLMDALLREGYRDPREVYLALRSDGAKGSGSIDDPSDGSVVAGSAVAISNLTVDPTQVVQEDVFRVASADPLWQWKGESGAISYFENQGPAGNLVRGEENDSAAQAYEPIEELRTRIEDALLLSL
jgi:hypothetical protein